MPQPPEKPDFGSIFDNLFTSVDSIMDGVSETLDKVYAKGKGETKPAPQPESARKQPTIGEIIAKGTSHIRYGGVVYRIQAVKQTDVGLNGLAAYASEVAAVNRGRLLAIKTILANKDNAFASTDASGAVDAILQSLSDLSRAVKTGEYPIKV